jgi:hypothetical protein
MSKASASREIKYIRKGLTYTSYISCDKGDLWQEYTGDSSDDLGRISPDWKDNTENRPTLELVVLSSKSAGGTVSISSNLIKWYLDDTELTFNATPGEDTTGYFYKNSDGTLKIIKNLAAKTGGVSCNIKASATIQEDGYQDTVTASTPVSIKKTSGTTTKVTIVAGDSNNFKITSNDGSCLLTLTIFKNGAFISDSEVRSGAYTFQWYKLESGSWKKADDGTGYSFQVKASDVDTYADFKVEVSNKGGSLIGSDIAGVWDVSDGYYILPGASPTSETIVAGSSDENKVTYTPKLYSKNSSGSDTQVSTSGFIFVLLDSIGGIVTPATTATTFTVTEDMVSSIGDVTLNISSVD